MEDKIEIKYEVEKGNVFSFKINEDGFVDEVDLGQVKVKMLVAFCKDNKVKNEDLDFFAFWETPGKCLGMYPIFEGTEGEGLTFNYPVSDVNKINN